MTEDRASAARSRAILQDVEQDLGLPAGLLEDDLLRAYARSDVLARLSPREEGYLRALVKEQYAARRSAAEGLFPAQGGKQVQQQQQQQQQDPSRALRDQVRDALAGVARGIDRADGRVLSAEARTALFSLCEFVPIEHCPRFMGRGR